MATFISFVVTFIYIVWYFTTDKSLLKVKWKDMRIDWKILKETVAIGSSSLARTVAGSVMLIVLLNTISAYGSELHLATMGVVNRVIMFCFLPIFGVVQGLQPIIGFNYGARQFARVKEALKLGIKIATVVSFVAWLILMGFSRPIIGLFSEDTRHINTAVPIMKIVILVLPVTGFQMVGASFFQAVGKAWPAFFLTLSRQIIFRVPSILILPNFYALMGVWVSFPLTDFLSAIVTYFYLHRALNQLENSAEIEEEEAVIKNPGQLEQPV